MSSRFFIDRPIFAWGDRAVHHRARRGVDHAAADRPVPDRGAAVAGHQRCLPGRVAAGAGKRRARRHRARDERRARHDLHGVDRPGQRHRRDHRHLRARHERRTRAGRGAEPPEPRLAPPAGVGRAAGRARGQGALELPDVRLGHVDEPRLRPDRARRLRGAQHRARAAARRRGRPGAALRHRAGDARLDRPREARRARPVAQRREQRHPRPERAGLGRLDR